MPTAMRLVTLVVFLIGCFACTAPAQNESFLNIPDPAEALATLNPDHPRLLIGPGGFEALTERVSADPQLSEWSDAIVTRAEAITDEPVSTYEIPDGKRLLATSRRVLQRTQDLAWAHHVTGDRRFLDRCWAELEAAASFKDWNPSHFLDTGEMTCAFGLAYDWLYHEWTPEQRRVLREAIVRHGLVPGRKSYRGEEQLGWWTRATHNWNQVCNGGLAIGALAIAESEPELAGEIISAGLSSLRLAMRSFAPDGGWAEGPGYWNYATRYNVLHIAAIESALGTDFGFVRFPGFDRAGDFPVHITGPIGRTFNFADGSDRINRAAQLQWLSARFDHPEYAAHQARIATPLVTDIIWGAAADRSGAEHPPLDRHFEGIGVVTMRSAWDDRRALFVGFKAGDNRVNHSHLDLGTFVLHASGQRWAMDLGSDDYNMPAYFGRQRWTYYRLRAEGHNTLIVEPGSGPDQDPGAKGRITRFESTPERALAIADLTLAHAGRIDSARRGIALFDGRSRVLVQDEVSGAAGSEIWWFMHTNATIEITPDQPARAVLSIGSERLEAKILSPSGAAFRAMDARPLPTSPDPSMQSRNGGRRKLAIRLEPTAVLRLAVLLEPLHEDAPPTPKVTPLDAW
jgi:hypothetical protein